MAVVLVAISAAGQTPQPFPRPGGTPTRGAQPAPAAPQPQPPPAPRPGTAPQAAPAPQPAPAAEVPGNPAPDPRTLGVPLYPTAQFIASYDAGRGQRYYLYGVGASFAEMVTYYRGQLRERGDLVFDEPPTHMFEVGRFRDETMAFPPGLTVKDWTWGGSQGYPNPVPGAQPERFPTVIMIVPPPAATATAR
jgi:hypothetical protein